MSRIYNFFINHILYDLLYCNILRGFPNLMPVSLVRWRGKTGVFYGKYQAFFNSSVVGSVLLNYSYFDFIFL